MQQEAQEKEKRINEQYVRSLDLLMQTLTRAGKLDAALAVRDEKESAGRLLGVQVLEQNNAAKQTANSAKPLLRSTENKIVEGEGWCSFRIGAKREDLIRNLGKPDNDPNGKWLQWKKKYAIHCIIDERRGAVELRFDEGFNGKTTAGIGIGSSLKQALAAYGEPSSQKDNGKTKELFWESKGLQIWFSKDKATQIVIFLPQS